MRKFYLLPIFTLLVGFCQAQTGTYLFDPSSVCIDGAQQALGSVTFGTGTFNQGCQVSAVDVTIWWAKTDGSCPSDYGVGGCSFHDETSFGLTTPGFSQTLAVAGTWSGCATSPNSVTTTFSTSAGTPPSGTPVSGTFSAGGGNMANMIGTSGLGTWNLLAGDNVGGDPLLVGAYNLSVTTIPDIINPTLTVPASFSVNSTAGTCGAVVTYSVSSYDLCGSTIARTAGPASGAVFPIGATTVTHRATDTYGRQTIQSFVVTVVDAQAPSISCPANITTPASSGVCSANVSYTLPTHSDLCTGSSLSLISGPVSGGSFNVGATTVTYRATDGAGNIANCSFTVTVTDTQNPQITCPGNSSINAAPGLCSATTTYSVPTATDNCSGVTVARTAGPASGGTFPVGATTVIHQATDASGNTASCSFVVTVVDNQNPTIVCPANISVNNTPNFCSGVVSWAAPVGTDNCPGSVTVRTVGPAPGSTFAAESTTSITYQVTDASSNSASCTFTVTVEDSQLPTITCPANITVGNDVGFCNAVVSYTTPSFTDNCPGVTIQQIAGLASNSQFGVISSPNVVTFRATDAAGNNASCSFNIIVNDTQSPSITCPSNIVVNNAPGVCNEVVSWTPPAGVDNCPGQSTVRTAGPAPGSTFNALTTTTITYTSTDAVNNATSCSFTVTVNDNEVPIVTCPANQSITFPNCQYALPNYVGLGLVTYSDNCAPLTVTQSPSAATVISQATVVQVSVEDPTGNESVCAFTVSPLDNTPPTFVNCPQASVQVAVNSSCQFFMPDYSTMAVSDVCNPTLTITQVPAAGAPQTVATSVVVTVSDGTNSTTCSFGVEPDDATPPTIICPADRTEPANASCQFVLPDYANLGSVSVSDNCDSSPTRSQPSIGNTITGSGTVTLFATDDSGNIGSCTFTVTVSDATAPTVTCPATQTVSNNANCTYTMASFTSLASATDNCPGFVTLSQSPSVGTSIGASSSLVTITGTDAAGNQASCQFTLVVEDNMAPNLACPSNQIVSVNSSCETTLLSYTGSAMVSDNCDGSPSVSQLPAVGTVISGTTTVTITATDDDLNSNTCTFSVIPQDLTNPIITCGANLNVNFNSSCQYTVGNYVGTPTASDNCGAPTITQSPALGTVITGTTTITMTATDGSGNAASCTFNLIPTDGQNPTISCPSSQNVNFSANCDFSLADYTGLATAADNCDLSVAVTQSPGFGSLITTTTTVTLTATDNVGNTATCTFSVIPADNTDPTITCPPNQSENFSSSCNLALPNYIGLATANDNCDNSVLVTQFPASGTVISGSQVITLTAVDDLVNSSSCTFTVLPVDNTDPTIVCPADQDVSLNAQCQYNLLNYTGLGTPSDNCDASPVVTQSPVSGSLIGTTTTITLTATDDNGNTGTCTFNVIPFDNTGPQITCIADQFVIADAGCEYELLSYISTPTVNDNCDPSPIVTQNPAAGFVISDSQVVTMTATDDDGNSSTCTFSIYPEDETDPTIICPSDALVSFNSGCQYAIGDYTGSATPSDNCDPAPAVTQSPASGTVITGTAEITLTVTDLEGNLGTCSFDVIPEDDADPTIACPNDQVVSSNASCQFLVVDYTAVATVGDNCDQLVTVTQSPAFGTVITVPTTVTLTAYDDEVNSASCSFLVTPADNDNPNITCPGDQVEDFDANCDFSLVDYTGMATATDNCSSSPTVTQSPVVGTSISGLTTFTLTATDADLNTASCTFNVIPQDNTDPVVVCPAAQTVSLNGLCQFVMTDLTGLGSVTDNCDNGLTITQSPVVGGLIGGATSVTLSSTDASGNIGTCSFSVTPVDNTAPVLGCPADITESFDGDCEFTLPSYVSLASVSDNCDLPPYAVTQSPVAGTVISGNTTITFSITDGNNNTSTCSFSILPEDDIDPQITCPGDQIVSFNGNCQFQLADYTGAASVSDNCDPSPEVDQVPSAGSLLSMNTSVTITVTDDYGNQTSCSFNVIPEDVTDPDLNCPSNVNVNFTSNCEFTIPDYTGSASFDDNCDNNPFISQIPGTGTIVTGATVVTFTVIDDAGNTSSCTFNVTPLDNQVPTVTCPPTITVPLSASCDYTVQDFSTLVIDNDNCDLDLLLIQSPSVGTTVSSNTTVTFTAIDDAGNSATCTFSLVLDDQTVPTISCPANQTVTLSANCLFVVPNYLGMSTSADNCDPSLSVTQSPLAGTLIGGTTVVTLTAIDNEGNIATCTFNVAPEDNNPPTILSCPIDITDVNDPGICGAVIMYSSIVSLDNCDGVVIPVLTTGQASGTIFPVGTTTVTYVATDGSGNSSSCEFDATVTDNEDPIIICPSDIVVNAAPFTCGAVVTYSLPDVTDNCTSPITPTLQAGSVSGSNFPVGITTVTYGANDGNGNTASCSFTITVEDVEAAVITCPADITVDSDPGDCDAVVSYVLPTVTDNCTSGIVPLLTAGLASGGTFELGVTTVSYSAEDESGNDADCSFTVTVEDNEDPIITCPANISVFVDPTTCQAIVSYNLPTVTDNCNQTIVPALQSGSASGSSFALGTETIDYLADDGNGNTASCSFTVTVEDNEIPLLTCPVDQTDLFSVNCTLIAPDYTILATSSDNCDAMPVITQSPVAGATLTGPVSTITLTSTDFSLNSTICTFTVSDIRPPVVSCPANQLVGSNINCQYALLNYTTLATSSDNCGAATLTQTPLAGTLISSLTTVVITSTDNLGNQATCQFTVTLTDNIAPSITCIGNQQAFFDANCQFTLPNYTGQAGSSDNCDTDPVITQSPTVGSVITGSSVITLTATDDNGNNTSCTFSVNPIDVISPSITCPSTQVAEFDASCEFTMPDYTGLGVTSDNCSSVITVTQSPVVGSVHTANTIVALTANDGNGNSSSCAFLVVPDDNIDPVIVCPADLVVYVNSNCEYSLINYTGLGTSSDNCSSSFIVGQSPAVGTIISETTTITLTTNDGNGNSSTCEFDVIPTDNIAPIISCDDDQAVSFNADCEFELVDYTSLASVSDNCSSNILVTQSPSAGTLISGTSTITFTADDGNGNVSNCSLQVIPADDTEPSILCPADLDVSFNQNCGFAMLNYTGLAVTDDNCESVITVTQNVLPGLLVADTVTVELTANDGNGNTASCTFNVNPSDNTAPTIICPPNANVSLNGDCEFIVPDYKLVTVVSDNCGPTAITQAPVEGASITVSTSVQMTVTDGNGNSVSCSFTVVPSDDELPVINCPASITVSLNANCQYPLPDYGAQGFASDNCTSPLLIAQFPPIGTVIVSNTTVTLSAQDASGNTSTCSLVVTVEDDTEPVLSQCPEPVNAVLNSNCAYVVPNFLSQITATDNCDASISYVQQPLAGATFSGSGIYPIILGASDDAGNYDTCMFNVVLTDFADPTVTCPPDQLVGLDANCQYVIPSYTSLATASDACGTVILTQSPAAATIITGQLNATIIATDGAGNTTTCTFFVNVVPMTISVSGTDVTCNNGTNGSATVSVTGGTPPYTENWGGFDPNALSSGNYEVTVSDVYGCDIVGSVTIENGPAFEIEIDPTGDVQICSGEFVVLDAGSGFALYNWSTGASVQSITVSTPASYWVTATNAEGCVSNTDTVYLSFYPPLVPDVTLGGDGVLYCTNDTSSSYQWYFNGGPIANATSYWYCPTLDGNYYVRIIDENGCEVSSFNEEHTYDPTSECATGIQEHDLSMDIYPNPSTGQFTVNYSLQYQRDLRLVVFDLLGKQVGEEVMLNSISGTTIVDLSGQADGVYSLRVVLGKERVFQERLVLVK
jgi:hypothetical protein